MKRLNRLALLTAIFIATPARASMFGEENGTLLGILAQNVSQGLQLSEQLTQLRTMVSNARENYEFARTVYAGIDQLKNFDPDAFLEQGRVYFLNTALVSDTTGFVHDVTTHGLAGGTFNLAAIRHRVDIYLDAARRAQAQTDQKRPYDVTAALGVSAEAEIAVRSPEYRRKLLADPPPSTATEGLIEYEAARSDPRLLALLMHMRAESEETSEKAFQLYMRSLHASPGEAQQINAVSASLATAELARLNNKGAKSLAIEQLRAAQQATDAAHQRAEVDAAWTQIAQGFATPNAIPAPAMPSLSDK